MLYAASTYVYVRQRLHPGLLDGLARAGVQAFEIFCARGHFDYHNRAHIREIADWFKSSGGKLHSMHSPMFYEDVWGGLMTPINLCEIERKRQIEAMDEIKRALEVAETVPFKFLVQHLGNAEEAYDSRKFEAAMTSVEHLRAFAKPLGVTLLLENIPNEISTPQRLNELVSTAHFDDVGFCFDTGHAHIMGGLRQAFEQMKPNIRSTHVHDNAAELDNHLWLGDGTIDWKECAALLRSAPHLPPVLLEIEGEDQADVLSGMKASFARFEKALNS